MDGQLDLSLAETGGSGVPPQERPPAVAAVAVDVALPHLDRLFEYAVPPDLDDAAQPGVRVKVRFSGKDVDGFVIERRSTAEHTGTLTPIRRVVSPEPVLTPHLYAVCRALADSHAGTFADVVRLAVPPRHARAEAALGVPVTPASDPVAPADLPECPAWAAFPAAAAFVRRVTAGEAPAAAWTALPSQPPERDWPAALAHLVAVTLAAGRGAIVVVPDHRDLARVDLALSEVLGKDSHVTLSAAQGPQARYTAWLKVLRGHVRVVLGTRAAAFAPVHDLGLVLWWDDGDDVHAEPRAPYPHVRDVLAAQAAQTGAAILTGGFARSVAIADWVARGRMRDLTPDPVVRRSARPRVRVPGEREIARDGPAAHAQLPPSAWRAAKDALATGPVLVQVPRRGYLPSLRCAHCREPARCARCHGPVAVGRAGDQPRCTWCGWLAVDVPCRACGSTRLRAGAVGSGRTAEELGRAFAGVPVVSVSGSEMRESVDDAPALVVATPGAEPIATGGYAAVLLLDAWASLDRPGLDASVEALRRWFAAAALVRPGGSVVVSGVPDGPALAPVEALVRWAPEWLAERELTDRGELRLPPSSWMGSVTGPRRAVTEAADQLAGVGELIGPIPGDDPAQHRLFLRVPLEQGSVAAQALAAVRATRSARKAEPVTVRVGVDIT